MGSKLSLEQYLEKVPESFRSGFELLELFNGNRTNIAFTFSCGCGVEQCLRAFLKRDQFEYCTKCKPKESHRKSKFDNASDFFGLVEGADFVVCSVCGFHAKSLGTHVSKVHGIAADEYKKTHQIICQKSIETYRNQNGENGDWIERAKDRGEDISDYCERMGNAVRDSILSNPEDRKRRAGVMAAVNRSEVMRKKASDTAKKTSARRDIQLQRVARIHAWQKANPDKFANIISKLTTIWNSKPESLLYHEMTKRTQFNFRRHQKLRSEKFLSFYKQKDIDIGDTAKRVYIEYDGPLHFKQTTMNQLANVQEKDRLLDEHIIEQGWVLIRVGYDQFSYRKSDYGFLADCLAKIDEILNDPKPGVHRIENVYENNK